MSRVTVGKYKCTWKWPAGSPSRMAARSGSLEMIVPKADVDHPAPHALIQAAAPTLHEIRAWAVDLRVRADGSFPPVK